MKSRFAFGLAVCLVLGLLSSSRAPRLAAQQASWNGSYSAAQAKRGEGLYAQNCVACHGKDLAGGDRAPMVGGPGLVARWSSRSLRDLLDYMQVRMPLNSPGGLTRRQNADILAFMLSKSGTTPGQADLWIEGPDSAPP